MRWGPSPIRRSSRVNTVTAMTTTTKADVFERFGRSHIEVADFESDMTVEDWAQLYRSNTINLGPLFFSPFAEVSPVKLKAAAHTDTNLIQPSVVITDTTGTPYAGLDMRDTPARQPAVSVHFLPSDFGITGVGNYVFQFYVESTSSITLKTSGLTFLPGVTVQGLGPTQHLCDLPEPAAQPAGDRRHHPDRRRAVGLVPHEHRASAADFYPVGDAFDHSTLRRGISDGRALILLAPANSCVVRLGCT